MLEEKRWIHSESEPIPGEFRAAIGGHPLVAETLFRRGFQDIKSAQAFMNPDDYHPCTPDELPDSLIAYALLTYTIQNHQHILVWGDFDVDGQTATTVLVQGLRELGGQVRYHIPIRAKESHGITHKVLKAFLDKGIDFLITCDTGISEHENIQFARQTGIPVIVTDHHTLAETLPPANAVVNPQRLPEDHPLRTLPGVGVAYKLIEGLFASMHRTFKPEHYLDLVSLGIVADVAELQGDTRYLLQKGLAYLRTTKRIGLQTLYRNANLNPLNLNEDHIGFQIAPRLNAVGRLGDANPIVEFLTTEDSGRARVLAVQIEAMNVKRRFETRQVEKAAESQLEASPDDRHAPAIVLHHPRWPGGVVGIVASRLVERYHKPVILLTGEDPIHGSARSIEGINITEAIASQSDRLISFGGHPMAAGLSFYATNLLPVKRGFLSVVAEQTKDAALVPEFQIDHVITLDKITMDLVNQIQRLAPFGPGNPRLNFLIKDLNLVSTTNVGAQGEHRQIITSDTDENQHKFIWWNGGDEPLPEAQFDLICTLSRSDYRGIAQVSAVWGDYRLSKRGQRAITQQHYEIVDYRDTINPLVTLKKHLQEHTNALVWAEVNEPESIPTSSRHALEAVENLVIWTAPPSQGVLQAALRKTSPQTVIVLGLDPNLHYRAFLERLIGLAKYANVNKAGQVSVEELAAACASEEETVRVGLRLLEVMGKLQIDDESDIITIDIVKKDADPEAIEIYRTILKNILEESQSYRNYFKSGDINDYLPGRTSDY
ncbi:MAG: single-stranded-DNA-specific exonuclease RecJ [Chloroflexota bacterium]|nr:single-stranded-DNA-specific exonuclease RecJ [Chloroflexota bacterium]